MSDANRSALRYAREASFKNPLPAIPTDPNTAGTLSLFNLRYTKSALDAGKQTVVSDEIRSDRQVSALVQVGQNVTGSFDQEVILKDIDDLVEAVLQSDYLTNISVTATVSGQTLTASTGTPFAAMVGSGVKFVQLANMTTGSNNGIKTVVSITNTVITFAAGSLSGSDADNACIVSVNGVINSETVSCTATVSDSTIMITGGTAFSAALAGARYVKVKNSTGFDGIRKVSACLGSNLALDAKSGDASVGSSTSMTFTVNYVRQGTTYSTHVFQQEFLDVPAYIPFVGVGFDTMDLTVEAQKISTVSFSVMGYKGIDRLSPVTGTILPASTNVPNNAASNIGSITKDGQPLTNPVKSVALKVSNNLRERPVVGDLGSLLHGTGRSEITGTASVYFTSKEIFDQYIGHTPMALEFEIVDLAGNTMNVFLPCVQSTSGTPQPTGINTDVMQTVAFQAILDPTLLYQIQVDRLAA